MLEDGGGSAMLWYKALLYESTRSVQLHSMTAIKGK